MSLDEYKRKRHGGKTPEPFGGGNARSRKRRFVVQSLEGGGWGGRAHEDGTLTAVKPS